ncbi:hypothetical protein ACFWB2_44460 [Streptomyces virginiae]|uniref:hypothetical protein n=1 Tax=Streptomyces virginiae TaxID=1961 RepID=UPI0036A3768F
MSEWVAARKIEKANLFWTEECQGITTDGSHFFISTNAPHPYKGVHKFSLDLRSHLGHTRLPLTAGGHPGDLDWDNMRGHGYVPCEPFGRIWIIDEGLNTVKIASLGDGGVNPQGEWLPWCAVNPVDGLLYSSRFDADRIYAYDPDRNFRWVRTVHLPQFVRKIQGGFFSPNGLLYLASDHTRRIICHDLGRRGLRGGSLAKVVGTTPIPVSSGWEEVEGLALCHLAWSQGADTWVIALVLDNDANTDDVFLHFYSVPDPTAI